MEAALLFLGGLPPPSAVAPLCGLDTKVLAEQLDALGMSAAELLGAVSDKTARKSYKLQRPDQATKVQSIFLR